MEESSCTYDLQVLQASSQSVLLCHLYECQEGTLPVPSSVKNTLTIWRLHLLTDIRALENVQRRTTKFILNDHLTDYHQRQINDHLTDYRQCLVSLNLLPLMMIYASQHTQFCYFLFWPNSVICLFQTETFIIKEELHPSLLF